MLETKTQCVRDNNKSKRKKDIFSLLFKEIFVFKFHKNFFEQLSVGKKKKAFLRTVSTIPERIVETTANYTQYGGLLLIQTKL